MPVFSDADISRFWVQAVKSLGVNTFTPEVWQVEHDKFVASMRSGKSPTILMPQCPPSFAYVSDGVATVGTLSAEQLAAISKAATKSKKAAATKSKAAAATKSKAAAATFSKASAAPKKPRVEGAAKLSNITVDTTEDSDSDSD